MNALKLRTAVLTPFEQDIGREFLNCDDPVEIWGGHHARARRLLPPVVPFIKEFCATHLDKTTNKLDPVARTTVAKILSAARVTRSCGNCCECGGPEDPPLTEIISKKTTQLSRDLLEIVALLWDDDCVIQDVRAEEFAHGYVTWCKFDAHDSCVKHSREDVGQWFKIIKKACPEPVLRKMRENAKGHDCVNSDLYRELFDEMICQEDSSKPAAALDEEELRIEELREEIAVQEVVRDEAIAAMKMHYDSLNLLERKKRRKIQGSD